MEENLNDPLEPVRLLNRIEQKFSVDSWSCLGIPIWPLLRWEIYVALTRPQVETRRAAERKNIFFWSRGKALEALSSAKSWINATFSDRSLNSNPLAPTDALFWTSGMAQSKLCEKWYDLICDPMREELATLGIRSTTFVHAPRYRTPRFSDSFFLAPYLDIASLGALLSAKVFDNSSSWVGFDGALEMLSTRLPETLLPTRKQCILNALRIRFQAALLYPVLKAVRPKVVFCVCYYSVPAMAMIFAAKKLNIPTVDIQHGVQSSDHPAYASWHKVPPEGYPTFPEFFWCWGPTEAFQIQTWSRDKSKAITGCNLLIRKWKEHPNELMRAMDSAVSAQFKAGEKIVLVSLSPTTLIVQKRREILLEMVRSSPSHWHWLFRAHPSDYHLIDDLQALVPERVKVKEPSFLPLFSCLKVAKVHVTELSTVIFEAKAFGVPTVLIDPLAVPRYQECVDQGWASLATDAESAVEAIAKYLQYPFDWGRLGDGSTAGEQSVSDLATMLKLHIHGA